MAVPPEASSLVDTFNALPSTPYLPNAIPNHWHISLRPISLSPPSTILFLVNPQSRYVHVEGPIPPNADTQSLALRANVYAMLLLKAFNNGLGAPQDVSIGRPASWSMGDAEVAGAIGEVLRGWGVKGGLDTVGVAEEEERRVSDECWEGFVKGLEGMQGAEG